MLALGQGVLDSHQTVLMASFTRTRRTVTHSAGVGSVAFKEVRKTHFLGNVIERHAAGVLALYLPAREDKPDTIKDEVHFCPAGSAAAKPGRHIGQLDEPHEFEGERFKREAANVAVLGFQLRENVL